MGREIYRTDSRTEDIRVIFTELKLNGAYKIDLQPAADDRGFFARAYCRREFADRGLQSEFVQCNVSYNKCKGTLRGMHYQVAPSEEVKLVRITKGSIYDVIIDLRPFSKTYMKHEGILLSEENRTALYIPKGFAHGFITMQDETEIFYQMSEFYAPEAQRGVRWNDPAFGIDWPIGVRKISERDNNYPDYDSSHVK
jgi:dTDP-4-dehydrorhamnose 3,5-epimerase